MLITQITNGLHRIRTVVAWKRRKTDNPREAAILAEYGDALAAASYIMDTLAEHGVATVNDLPIRLTPSAEYLKRAGVDQNTSSMK